MMEMNYYNLTVKVTGLFDDFLLNNTWWIKEVSINEILESDILTLDSGKLKLEFSLVPCIFLNLLDNEFLVSFGVSL